MRDVILTAIVFGLVPFFFTNPVLGTYVWAWLGMMSPHRATYGFAYNLPFAYIVAIATLVPFIFSKQRRPLPVNTITVVLLLLLGWMCVTSVFALNTAEVVLERVIFFGKIQLMLFVTMMLVRGRRDIERLIWVVTFSIGFYGIKGGIWTVLTGGNNRVYGPPGSLIEENNALAIASVVTVPFVFYLYQTANRKLVRHAMLFCLVAISFSILGSQSRGALLALLAMAGMLGLKSEHPFRATVMLAILMAVAIAFMPESWSTRMETIQGYEADGSAMSRLYSWQTMWNLALDRPLVGAGFRADSFAVFARYAPYDGAAVFGGEGVYVAHSIYFQALGEHGFPGLALYLMLGIVSWRKAGQLAKLTQGDPDFGSWVPVLMPMVQVGVLGFAVGGAFLNMMNFDIPYYIIGYVVMVDATVRDRLKVRALELSSAPSPPQLQPPQTKVESP